MKKSLVLAMSLAVSTSVFAANEPAKTQPTNQPMIKVAVYDVSNKVAREVGHQYSVSNKNLRLCWAAFNMSFQPSNTIVEEFFSPAKAKFSEPNGSVVTSKDAKKHTVTTSLAAQNNEYIQKCWHFDKSDPLGKYKLNIRVNNTQFDGLEFELVK